MKEFIYQIAKSIVDKRQVKKEAETKKWAENNLQWQAKKAFIKDIFIKKFIRDKEEEFKKATAPKYSVGEKVLTNWFHGSNHWWGGVQSYQSHTPYKGPLVVKIEEVSVDSNFLEDILDNFQVNGKFDDLLLIEDHYSDFCEIANKGLVDRLTKILADTISVPTPVITWVYKIYVPKEEKVYWTYSWPEEFLIRLDSAAALLSQKAWKKDQKANKNYAKADEAKKELSLLLKELSKQTC